jgi:glycolate oxidase iron-sulfur subunit
MQTNFSAQALTDPAMRDSETALRKCVHCGFCLATCPTYVELGDELDSPRGRIYLMKAMLEEGRAATPRDVRHIDRCLSCLACMTTCPSGVNYMHLVDQARAWIETSYRRPYADRTLRALLAWVLPRPTVFRWALRLARFGRPFAPLLPPRLKAMLALAPARVPPPSPADQPQSFAPAATRVRRVALLTGCAQRVLAPQINAATIRLLTRLGCEVVVAPGAGCCGALTHHMGKEASAHAWARANVDAWWRVHEQAPLDAIVINASGCGTTVKDYGRLLRTDSAYAERAGTLAAMTRDVTELLAEIGLHAPAVTPPRAVAVTYHAACSLQHGQRVREAPKALLRAAGFTVCEPSEAHLCCGSAGTYNLLQPEIAGRLKARKLDAIARTAPDVIATGNIGCMTQLAGDAGVPVVHTVELLDWATGGPQPAAMAVKQTRPLA